MLMKCSKQTALFWCFANSPEILDVRKKVCAVQEGFHLQPLQSCSNLQDCLQATCSCKETEDPIAVYSVGHGVFKPHMAKLRWKRCSYFHKGWKYFDTTNSSFMAVELPRRKYVSSTNVPLLFVFLLFLTSVWNIYREKKEKSLYVFRWVLIDFKC